jgi:hydrogenase maturation protease
MRDALPGSHGGALVVGVGNELRGDDAAGLLVARAVGGRELSGDPVGLLELWDGAPRVVVVDATRSGAAPGTIRTIDGVRERLPLTSRFEGHTGGVAEAIALARELGRLPDELLLVGIEGASFELGRAVSEPVRAAVAQLTRELSPQALAGATPRGQGAGPIPSRSANATPPPVAKDSGSR